MQARIIAWVVVALVVFGAVKLGRATGNPWAKDRVLDLHSSAAALHIPGCADHPAKCAQ